MEETQTRPVTGPDFIEQAIALAVELNGGPGPSDSDGMFTAAGFSQALGHVAHINCHLDGALVAAILSGRHDVVRMPDGAYYVSMLVSLRASMEKMKEEARSVVDGPMMAPAMGTLSSLAQAPNMYAQDEPPNFRNRGRR